MHTNVLAAMRLLPIIAPMVCAGRGKLGVLSSRMGSIGERTSAGGSLYRASKAALNSVLIDTALTYGKQGATCVAFHPGWVRPTWAAPAPISRRRGKRVRASAHDQRLPASEVAVYRNYDGTAIGLNPEATTADPRVRPLRRFTG
jgi:NAD(P)-dependent dehydrogenase (short-subunit alcohol dehydrogenase family)